ncbi:MAG: bifunctional DNA-formamidopyrimidine glycosylase/DNA-(apurinic or apyrimidinic site) lyase [Planctomycetes bacterium]|nr:bifunctional DNA-formamidopyrimidine glycosylase/DNA-(apurinic or apyrimidinic site) lyase [Planctomycetota bacterium]
MPELPEIEHLRQTLLPVLIRAEVRQVHLARPDIVRDFTNNSQKITPKRLLKGQRIKELSRRGKQLAIIAEDGSVLCVQLGMTGQLIFIPNGKKPQQSNHIHCTWHLTLGNNLMGKRGKLVFRDPRRFGCISVYRSMEDLQETRWSKLGPESPTITTRILKQQLNKTIRPIKAALLDQAIIAGVGNIYADEALFGAKIHPMTPACSIEGKPCTDLARSLRSVLKRAIAAGGSSISDYVDGNGQAGSFSTKHKVYQRAGKPCVSCKKPLSQTTIAQRSTVYCENCQQLIA